MRKYIKPEIEMIKFDVESSVMAATPTPMPGDMTRNVVISTNTNYIPESVDQKVWTTVEDGENWNWE